MTSAGRGAACGLLAAALFGVSTPCAKRLLLGSHPQVLAGLLYLGAAAALLVYRRLRPPHDETPLRPSDLPTLAIVVAAGGVVAPVLMLVGLGRVTAVAGSLLLNLEAPFTIALAVAFYGEHLGAHAAAAAACIVAGAVALGLGPGAVAGDLLGTTLIAAACLLWALDNNLTQRLSVRDPFAVVRVKALIAGASNLALGLWLGGELPDGHRLLIALVVGALGYGASVVLAAYALRLVGAAREAAYFATAPFVGALASTLVVSESIGGRDALAMALMAVGVILLLRERHEHLHVHDELAHDHTHVHDEHHLHVHADGDPAGEPHAHPHRHAPLVHAHAHVPDVHHRHRH